MELERSNIQLGSRVGNKEEAIRQAGSLLVKSQYIKPGYIDSMMAREKVANTYLGNGISIPHGLPKDRDLILRTGISVLQVPDGVEWNPGERVSLVVGIAARSDEHLELLANLTHVLGDEGTVRRLSTTHDANDIIRALAGAEEEKKAPTAPEPKLAEFPNSVDATVQGAHGLHARPATAFVDLAKQFEAQIHVRHDGRVANAKSLVSLLQLGVEGGSTVRIMAEGPDASAALQALQKAVEAGLGDVEEEPLPKTRPAPPSHAWTPQSVGRRVPGIAASPGLAIGPIRQYRQRKIVVEVMAKDPVAEEKQLQRAIAAAQAELEQLYEEVKERSGAAEAAIFRAHAEFLDDPELLAEAIAHIQDGHSAGWSWQQAIEKRVAAMKKVDDALIAARAVDLGDVGSRVLKLLGGLLDDEPFVPDEPVILLADDLTPSDTATLDPAHVLGFCTASGGPTSHTAIIARSLNIPAIVATGPALLNQPDGVLGILDGDRGSLYLEPSEADVDTARKAQISLAEMRNAEYAARYEPALTTDGHRVEVAANIGGAAEAEQAVNAGAEGVGLVRTEFLFLNRSEPPSEEEQYEAYLQMVNALAGLPLIIRTLDIGGDKEVPYLNLPPEDNAFLGLRGIRLCLSRTELFIPQLRAIYRASLHGPIRIMFPMVSTVEDLTAAQDVAEQVRLEIGADPVETGTMIEVPAAALMADQLAKECDFFSIGTNDLAQYTLAMDRLHPLLAKRADALHPAVLRLVDQTVRAAQAEGKWVGVCGGMAGDPQGAILLIGLGVSELSMSIPSVAAVKAKIRGVSLAQAQSLAKQALACRNAVEVRRLPFA
ncbi:MAG: phosphoenolpyruvate--protein phosphotransferase [Anaerolineae bacterium]